MPWVGVSTVHHPFVYRCVVSMLETLVVHICSTIMYPVVTAITFCIQFVASFSAVEPLFFYWVPMSVLIIVVGGFLRTRAAPTRVLSTGGPRAACQILFVSADFRPGRACSAAGIACWGRRPEQEHDKTNSLANETTTQ